MVANEPITDVAEREVAELEASVKQEVEAAGEEVDVPLEEGTDNGPEHQGPSPFGAKDHEQMTLTWKNLSFSIMKGKKEKKRLLNNLSGSIHPGELVAIMGPSGAGKSTLLNVLASRAPYGTATGSIDVNGQKPKKMRKKIAYVMQEDALFPTQTPRETLDFTAALKMPELSLDERTALVESVLTALGLQRCADTMIGSIMIKGISGGEKKRVSIGVELISSPSLIFLDEPTSGLDSHSAYEVIKNLRMFAKAGSTIVCTIHQPSSEVFDLFTKVMLLRNGSLVYGGPVDGLVPYFASAGIHCKPNYNPADFAMHQLQILTDEEVAPLIAEAGMPEAEDVHEDDNEGTVLPATKANFFRQLYYLTKRESQQVRRDTGTLIARYGTAVVMSLLTGIFYFQTGDDWGDNGDAEGITQSIKDHWGALVFCAINAMFLSSQPMLLVFPSERPVFMRENATGTYGTTAYFLSKTLVELPATALQATIQYLIVYWMVHLNGNFFYLIVSTCLMGLSTSSLALMLSASTTRAEEAVNMMPIIFVPQILACGYFISTQAMPAGVSWAQWICPLKYGLALVSCAEFSMKWVPRDRETETKFILDDSDIDTEIWWVYAIVMVGLFVGFRVIAAMILRARARTFA